MGNFYNAEAVLKNKIKYWAIIKYWSLAGLVNKDLTHKLSLKILMVGKWETLQKLRWEESTLRVDRHTRSRRRLGSHSNSLSLSLYY